MKASPLLMTLLLTTFVGCTDQTKNDPHSLYIGLANPPTTLDPRHATDAYSQRISGLIFSALVRNGPDLKPMSEAAETWKVEKNKMTFILKSGLTFQNGRPITAQDVLYSFSEFQKPTSPFFSSLESIKAVTALDAKTIVLNLKGFDAPLLANLNDVKILPREEIEKFGDRFSEHPVGSGPFQFEKWDNNQLELKKTSVNCPYAHPKIESVVFKFVRDDNTRYLKMIKGDLDILLNELTEEKVSALKKTGKVQVLVSPGLNFNFLVLNFKDERLKSLPLRKALFAAINRDEIIKYKLDEMAALATTVIAPVSFFSNPNLAIPSMNLDEAQKTIKGLHLAGSTFTLLTSDQGLATGEILAQQIERLGIKITLKSYEWGTFYNDLKSGNFEIATSRWVGVVDPDVYRDSLGSLEVPPKGRNRGFYQNKTFDMLVENARHEMDVNRRKDLYFKAEQIAADDIAVIPLWYNSNISILSRRVKNFVPIVTGSFFPLTEATKE